MGQNEIHGDIGTMALRLIVDVSADSVGDLSVECR